jgi:transposase
MSWKTIETWVRIFKRDGTLDLKKKGRPVEKEDANYKERYEILKKYQDFLEEVKLEKK